MFEAIDRMDHSQAVSTACIAELLEQHFAGVFNLESKSTKLFDAKLLTLLATVHLLLGQVVHLLSASFAEVPRNVIIFVQVLFQIR